MTEDDARKRDRKIEQIRQRAEQSQDLFEGRKERALERLKREDSERERGKHLYIGLSTIQLGSDEVVLGGKSERLAVIRKVEEPPGEVELAIALNDKDNWRFGYIAHYARIITHELIAPIQDDDPQKALSLAWAITSLMRIRSRGQLIAPAYCTVPWSTVAAIKDKSCTVGFLDEYPKAIRFDNPPAFTADDLAWVSDNLLNWFNVWEVESFRLAAESYWSYYHHPNKRMMVANLWSGIEAFFDNQTEVTFRLALSIASLLEPRGQARIALCEKTRKLYGSRSAIIHGRNISDTKMRDHIIEASGILARLLESCVEAGAVWSKDQITTAIMA